MVRGSTQYLQTVFIKYFQINGLVLIALDQKSDLPLKGHRPYMFFELHLYPGHAIQIQKDTPGNFQRQLYS